MRWAPKALIFLAAVGCAPKGPSAPTETAEVAPEPVRLELPEQAAAPPACSVRNAARAMELLPAGLPVLARVDVSSLRGSPLWGPIRQALATDLPEALQDGPGGCGVTLEDFYEVGFGFDTETEELVIVIAARGIGVPDTARCIIQALEDGDSEQPAEPITGPVPVTGDPGLGVFPLDEGAAYLVTPDLVALVSEVHRGSFEARSRCEGTPGIAEPGRTRGIDPRSSAWIAGTLDPSTRDDLQADMAGILDFGLSVDVREGLLVSVRGGFEEPAQAQAVIDQATTMLPMFGAMVPGLEAATQRAELEAREREAFMSMSLTPAELEALALQLGQL